MVDSEMDKLCNFIQHYNNNYKLEYKIEKKRIIGQLLFKEKVAYSFWYSDNNENLFDDVILNNEFNISSSNIKLKKDLFYKYLKNKIFKILGIQDFNFM